MKENYKVISLVDVNQLLSFAKNEFNNIEEQIREEKRVEKELKEFVSDIERFSGHRIHFIGHEKRYGKHLIRFLLKDGGFLEVMVEKPLAINGHFISRRAAERFVNGLKKVLYYRLPESPIKNLVINSIKVEDGLKEEILTFEKWGQMHNIWIRKTLAISLVAIILFFVFELIQETFEYIALQYINIPSLIISLITAIIIAAVFEPLKELIDEVVEKILEV